MNLVVLYMLILVTQLSLFKSSPVADGILSSQLSNNGSDHDSKGDGVTGKMIEWSKKLSERLKQCRGSDDEILKLLKTISSPDCKEQDICSTSKISEYIENYCFDHQHRQRRGTFDQLGDDLFLPVRGRRNSGDQGSTQILAEKKAKLDVLTNDLFVPNRGRRQLVRKNYFKLEPYPLIALEKRNNIELDSMKDFFVPQRGKKAIDEIFADNFLPQRGKKAIDELFSDNFLPQRGKKAIDELFSDNFLPHRGKRQPTINDVLSDNFLPQRGKKAIDELLSDNFFPQRGKKSAATSIIIPKSNAFDYNLPMDSLQNINPYDRRMIDRRLHDLNLLLLSAAEANKDITVDDGEKLQQMYGDGKMMIFNPLRNDEFTSDGTNLIFANTPIQQDDAPNDFTTRFI